MNIPSFQPERWPQLLATFIVASLLAACGGESEVAPPAGSPSANLYKLTTDISGSGRLQSEPEGLSCTSSCNADFASGTAVTLTATPDASQLFKSWSGACTGSSSTCVVTMDQLRAVTATFESLSSQITFKVGVNVVGSGSVVSNPAGINCGASCNGDFAAGSILVLTAVPAAGQSFSGWTGACAGAVTTCSVRVNSASSVVATFAPITASNFDLAVAVSGNGAVTSSPAGINCGSLCTASYAASTAVTLTATPAAGQVFNGWGGSCAGSIATCIVQVTQLRSVQASFNAAPPAGVAFQPAQLLETNNDFNVGRNLIAINRSGDSLAVWEQSDGAPDGNTLKVYSRRYQAATGWQPAVVVAGLTRREGNPSQITGKLLMNDAGVVTWINVDMQTRRNSPTTGWGTAFAAPSGDIGGGLTSAVIDSTGSISVLSSGSNVYYNTLAAGASAWASWQQIDTSGPLVANRAELALSSNGTALAVWRESNPGDSEYSMKSARLVRSTGWSAPQSIEALFTGIENLQPKLVMDDQGNGVAMWLQGNGGTEVTYNIYRAGSGWQGEVRVPNLPSLLPGNSDVQLAMAADGRAVATWHAGGGTRTLRSMQYSPATGWTAPVAVFENVGFSKVAISDNAQAVMVYEAFFDISVSQPRLLSRNLNFGGQWSAPTPVSTGASGIAGSNFSMNQTGQGMAVWSQADVANTTGSRISLSAAALR